MRLIAPLAAVAALLLAGCATAPTGGGSADSAPQPAPMQPAAPDVASEDGLGASQPTADQAEQSVIVTGWVSLVAEAPVEAADQAAALAEAAGGLVSSRSESARSGDVPERAELELRVPADAVDALLDDLRDVGEVRDVDVTSVDVTQEVLDLDVRVASARASVDRLTALLASAADTETLLQIEAQLTTRTSELESLLAQQSALADQVALSTITVSIASAAVAGDEPPATFVDGLVAGWSALVAAAAGAAVAVGAALPWLVALAIPVLAVVLVVRSRRRKRATSPSAPPAGDDAAHLA